MYSSHQEEYVDTKFLESDQLTAFSLIHHFITTQPFSDDSLSSQNLGTKKCRNEMSKP